MTISVTIKDDSKAKAFLQLLAELKYVSDFHLTKETKRLKKNHEELKEALSIHAQSALSGKLG